MNEAYTIVIPLNGKHVILQEFTTSMTIVTEDRKPAWMTLGEIMDFLKTINSPIKSKATLLNYEKRGLLTTKRVSQRKIYFDKNEVEDLFSLKDK